jgi:hypothetical protein
LGSLYLKLKISKGFVSSTTFKLCQISAFNFSCYLIFSSARRCRHCASFCRGVRRVYMHIITQLPPPPPPNTHTTLQLPSADTHTHTEPYTDNLGVFADVEPLPFYFYHNITEIIWRVPPYYKNGWNLQEINITAEGYEVKPFLFFLLPKSQLCSNKISHIVFSSFDIYVISFYF